MGNAIRVWLYQTWYGKNKRYRYLLPLSWLFCLIVFIRLWLYRIGVFSQKKLPVPVIIIGNISVGGSGKTPLLIGLCQYLTEQGYRVGVISRGYGGTLGKKIAAVDVNSDPKIVGEEPVLIAQQANIPVFVGKDRFAAALHLIEKHHPQLILSDDGLQHYHLARDSEVIVIHGKYLLGNEHFLPAGPLRESKKRLKHADFVVYQDKIAAQENSFYLAPEQFVSLNNQQTNVDLQYFSGKTVHAIAGIAHPKQFFEQLRALDIDVIVHPFADHHQYQSDELLFKDDYPLIMTQKDAIKCAGFQLKNAWALSIKTIISPHFEEVFLKRIEELLNG